MLAVLLDYLIFVVKRRELPCEARFRSRKYPALFRGAKSYKTVQFSTFQSLNETVKIVTQGSYYKTLH